MVSDANCLKMFVFWELWSILERPVLCQNSIQIELLACSKVEVRNNNIWPILGRPIGCYIALTKWSLRNTKELRNSLENPKNFLKILATFGKIDLLVDFSNVQHPLYAQAFHALYSQIDKQKQMT